MGNNGFMDLVKSLSNKNRTPWGDPNLKRYNDQGFKRNGFLGPIPVTGGYATEYSIGDEYGEMPTIVPTLTRDEIDNLRVAIGSNGDIPESIIRKAREHAAIRRAVGLSPFAGDNESPIPTRHPGPWSDEYVYPEAQPSAILNKIQRAMLFGVGK